MSRKHRKLKDAAKREARAASAEKSWAESAVRMDSRWKWLGLRRAKQHAKDRKVHAAGDRIIHAVIQLHGNVQGAANYGKPILIGCSCCAVFWRDARYVKNEMISGDWARPFREYLKVPARAMGSKR